jgi:hypothetical protein
VNLALLLDMTADAFGEVDFDRLDHRVEPR